MRWSLPVFRRRPGHDHIGLVASEACLVLRLVDWFTVDKPAEPQPPVEAYFFYP
jgi:hypothetical protein